MEDHRTIAEEYGWFLWEIQGRNVSRIKRHESDPNYFPTFIPGYLVGDRFIHRTARVVPDPDGLISQTVHVCLVPPELDRFTPVQIGVVHGSVGQRFVFVQETFPEGAEDDVRQAFLDRRESLDGIPHVTPALDLSFRFAVRQREVVEQRRAELERQREEERRREEMLQRIGTGAGRRELAVADFEEAARHALRVGGAELLDIRRGVRPNERIVQYRLDRQRFECVAEAQTLRIVDSGICLTDERTGEKGDTRFTLESLPSVVRQAIDEGRLVVYRHVE